MAEPVTIRLLGQVGVMNRPEASLPQKCKALLCLLGRHPGTPIPRSRAAGMLWSESDEARARTNLRQCLRRLRAVLGREALPSEGDYLVLSADQVHVDVTELDSDPRGKTPSDLAAVARLYVGTFGADLSIPDAPFQDWLSAERAHIHELAAGLTLRAVEACLASDDAETAIRLASDFLRHDPLLEELHRGLIRSLVAEGRRGAAIEQYRRLRETLSNELGVGPDAATERLAASVLQQDPGASAAAVAATPDAGPQDIFAGEAPAIAILSIALSEGPVGPRFARGLAEELIVSLSGWRTFPVVSAASSLRDPPVTDPIERGRQLKAGYVVSCSLRQGPNRIRITARLLDTGSSHEVWAENFDTGLSDIIDTQEEMARQIAAIVKDRAERREIERIVWKRTRDLAAWEHVLVGQDHLRRSPKTAYSNAIAHFKGALEIDPTSVDALIGLATSYCWIAKYTAPPDRHDALSIAEEHVRRAVDIDWNSAAAHARLGAVHVWKEDFDRGLQESELAVHLNPSDAHARLALGNRLDLIGRSAEGIAQMETGLRLSPQDPMSADYMGFLARALLVQGRTGAALALARRAVLLHPSSPDAQYRLAACLASADDIDAARAALFASEHLLLGFLAAKAEWAPYSDRARNGQFFDGLRRHGLVTVGPGGSSI
ncbi:BTAD domain-containing putative transcriptional regulator [Roseovarius sp. D22-M7]|uniref:BTAD domain-containing putative transcriptional regulator n=1 Tax=Roseovarius sp. D22-M7 TaxID=3127116 RepID=UPI00300FD7B4